MSNPNDATVKGQDASSHDEIEHGEAKPLRPETQVGVGVIQSSEPSDPKTRAPSSPTGKPQG